MNSDTIATADSPAIGVHTCTSYCCTCKSTVQILRTLDLSPLTHWVCASCAGSEFQPVDPAVLALAHRLPLAAIVDHDLCRRAVDEGYGFADEEAAYDWVLNNSGPGSGCRPNCYPDTGCIACNDARFVLSLDGQIAQQEIDPVTGVPHPPERKRLYQEALNFRRAHVQAQPWLNLDDPWPGAFDDL